MIHIRNLDFRYGDEGFRLQIPRLDVAGSEHVAMIGPSGSGKTTLLNIVSGIVLPSSGRVTTCGREVSALSDAARRDFRIANIGLVFQDFELVEYLNLLDNVLLPYRINRSLRLSSDVRCRALQLIGEVGLDDKLRRFSHQLSQGERQRVAICRALLPGPSLILADEPTGNLDPRNKQRVLDILLDYTGRSGATLVTVTHDHGLLERFDRVIDFQEYHSAV